MYIIIKPGGKRRRPRSPRRPLLSPWDLPADLAAPDQIGRWGATAGEPGGMEHDLVVGGTQVDAYDACLRNNSYRVELS